MPGNRMHGLTVRWSLVDCPAGVLDELKTYVADVSFDRFSGRTGLRFKTWRAKPGAWFEGAYVFDDDAARDAFQREFEAVAATAPASELIGSAPILIEPCEIVAIAEGPSGFSAARRVD